MFSVNKNELIYVGMIPLIFNNKDIVYKVKVHS